MRPGRDGAEEVWEIHAMRGVIRTCIVCGQILSVIQQDRTSRKNQTKNTNFLISYLYNCEIISNFKIRND
jgi:hypothetical protein